MIATVAMLARLDVARIWWRGVGAAAVSAGVAHLDRAEDERVVALPVEQPFSVERGLPPDDSSMRPVGVRTVRDNLGQ